MASRLRTILRWILGEGVSNVGALPHEVHDVQQWLAWYIGYTTTRRSGLTVAQLGCDTDKVDGWLEGTGGKQLMDAESPEEPYVGIVQALVRGPLSEPRSRMEASLRAHFGIMGVRSVGLRAEGCTRAESSGEVEGCRWAMQVYPDRVEPTGSTVHFADLMRNLTVTRDANHSAECPMRGLSHNAPALRARGALFIEGGVGKYLVVDLIRGTHGENERPSRCTRQVTYMPWDYQMFSLFPDDFPASVLEQHNPVYKVCLRVEPRCCSTSRVIGGTTCCVCDRGRVCIWCIMTS